MAYHSQHFGHLFLYLIIILVLVDSQPPLISHFSADPKCTKKWIDEVRQYFEKNLQHVPTTITNENMMEKMFESDSIKPPTVYFKLLENQTSHFISIEIDFHHLANCILKDLFLIYVDALKYAASRLNGKEWFVPKLGESVTTDLSEDVKILPIIGTINHSTTKYMIGTDIAIDYGILNTNFTNLSATGQSFVFQYRQDGSKSVLETTVE